MNGISNSRSQSSDGESLPDDVFHDDSTVGGASGKTTPTPALTPPTASSTPPPKPLRVGGSRGLANLIKKSREIGKRTNSESELTTPESSKEGSKSTSDSKGGGGRRWSFKGGKGRRQQSVPVDVNLTGSVKIDISHEGDVTGLTGLSSSVSSMSPQPPSTIFASEATPTQNETTPTNNSRSHPLPPSSSSTHSNNNTNTVDLETVHEGSALRLDSKAADSDKSSPPPPSREKFAAGKANESKPSPKPRGYGKQGRGKLFSDSQVLEVDREGRGGGKDSAISEDKDGDSRSARAGPNRRPGRDTLERDNMLLREQVKLLKGQNKKLKTENKEYRHKLKDCGEWDGPATSGSTSQSESVSSCVVSPRETPPSSKESSRVPSESPSHPPHPHPHHEEGGMMSSSSPERIRLRHSLSPSSVANPGSGEGDDSLRLDDEKRLAEASLEKEAEKDVDNDEVRDVPGSLPSSSSGGMGVLAKAGSQNGFASKSKPIPIPRSTALSVGGASDVVKANEGKVTRGFLMRVQSLDSGTSSNVKTVKLESFVPKLESPIPKPRVVASRSQAVSDGKSSGDSNKVKDKEISELGSEDLERIDDSNEAKDERGIDESDNSNKENEEKILKARKLLENVLPHPGSQRPTKPSILPRSMSAREEEGLKPEVPLSQRATSSSPIGKVGMVTLGDNKGQISPGKQPEKSSAGGEKIENDGEEVDEKAASMTSSNTSSTSSITKTSPLPIVKPLPPLPLSSSSATKPLPPTPSSSSSSIPPKPLPPTPSSSSVPKPLPPTPLSSSVPKPLPPTPSPPSSSSSATKPLPPKPIKMSTSVPPSPPPSALSGSISPKTPTTRIVAGYKKVTIQSDTSWINRKKESSGHECTDHPLETSTQSTGSVGGGSVTTPTNVQSPGAGSANRPHAPYRSHAILSGPSSGSSGSKTSLLSPAGKPYGGSSELKPGPIGKPPPPKVLNSRFRTESLSTVEQSKEASKKDGKSDLLRSTSEENIVAAASTAVTAKGKGQSKGGGFFSRTGSKLANTPKEPPPPKKPARSWLRGGKDKGSPQLTRPMSAVVIDPPTDDRSFTASCTMPRGTQPEESKYSPKNSRRKPEDLSNGSPGNTKKSKGLFGRLKTKSPSHGVGAPPLEEEPEDNDSDSSSDDEKGGTIKFKPKLRHVSVKKPLSLDDDSEPEYHQLFEYVFVVGLKEKSSGKDKGKLTTELTYNFPPASDAAKKDLALQSIPQFCFPDVDQWKPVKEYKSESFSFVLTDMEGGRRYGYCRRLLPQGSGKRLPEVYCIVSPLGCFSLYEKILDHVEERRSMATAVSVFTFLKAIVANPFPRPGRSVEVPVISARGTGMETVVFERPMDSRLEHVDFSLLFNTLSQRKVIQVFSSLLMERRVILCAQSLSLVSGCAHALLALLYPFEWQHVFIPVLPSGLIDFVCSPLPYIIGINPSCIKQIETMETMEEALIVDLEKKKFVRKIGDEASILPTKLFQFLEHSLSSAVVSGEYSKKSSDAASRSRADEILVNTFMTFFAYLYGDYKSFMSVTNPARGEKEFRRKDFVKKFSSKSTKRFLEAFQMTQMFENFIEQRENPSKAATVSESLFERKIPDLSLGCQEIEIFSSKSRFDRWRIKKGFAKNN